MTTDLASDLARIGLRATSAHLPDFLSRATKARLSPQQLLEELVRHEALHRAQKSLDRRLKAARLGSFRAIADFDWTWPKKIDRDLLEQALALDFITAHRNLVLLAPNGLGKTMFAKNIAYQAVQSGYTALFRNASDLLTDLSCDSPEIRRRRFAFFSRPDLLVIDEVGYLSYDDRAADLLYEIVTRRYERRSLVITTNLPFASWNTVFPNATCLGTLLDRLTHHADIAVIEGDSYRTFESRRDTEARRRKK